MLEEATKTAPGKLDEFRLRDELRALRTKIPDTPALNPIVSLGFRAVAPARIGRGRHR